MAARTIAVVFCMTRLLYSTQLRANSSASLAVQSPRGFSRIASHHFGEPTSGAQAANHAVRPASTIARQTLRIIRSVTSSLETAAILVQEAALSRKRHAAPRGPDQHGGD